MKLKNRIWHFLYSEDGPTAVEYAIMLALIIIVSIISVRSLGTNTAESFEPVRDILAAAP